MASLIPAEPQGLSEECRLLLHEIGHLQRQVAGLRKEAAVDFVMSLGSPAPGTVLAHGHLGPRVKRTLVDGQEVPHVVVADTARGFVLYAVQPTQVKPGAGDIWLDIRCGKVTIEYEGGPEDLKAVLRDAAARRPKDQGSQPERRLGHEFTDEDGRVVGCGFPRFCPECEKDHEQR
nr:hypothetical protein [uncultured Pseudomonas sp.]